MSQMIQSKHGLHYLLSDDVFESMYKAQARDTTIWDRLNVLIEGAETLPIMISDIIYVTTRCCIGLPWFLCLTYAVAGLLGGFLLHLFPPLFYDTPLGKIAYGYYLAFMRSRIAAILILLLGFLLKPWFSGFLVCMLVGAVDAVIIATLEGYHQRESFNDALARVVLERKPPT